MNWSYQLYSSREFGLWSDVLEELARLGYGAVEGFPGLYHDPPALRAAMDARGLVMPSGHFPLEMLEGDLAKVVEIAASLGIARVYCPYLDEEQRPRAVAGWRALGNKLEALAGALRHHGLAFGWHNHDFEFALLEDGATPMAHLLAAAPSIAWEADLAWIQRGGGDPLHWVEAEHGRMTAIHVKDIAPEGQAVDEDGWADLGDGVVDWAAIFRSLRARDRAPLMVLEHDKPRDPSRFARRSLDAARALWAEAGC